MCELEKKYLFQHTPCQFSDMKRLALSLGIVHVELIVIHPFREGNGRAARLLTDLMAMQADMPPLNYQAIDQLEHPEGFQQYIEAIHADLMEIIHLYKIFLLLCCGIPFSSKSIYFFSFSTRDLNLTTFRGVSNFNALNAP